jgi:hypothetical protein
MKKIPPERRQLAGASVLSYEKLHWRAGSIGNARERRLANEFAQRLDDSSPEVVGLR